ncbi:PREDICTED: ATP-dependent RNA helicase-like protein DB10 isoform X2 [Ipomoea nil]|uniref:ATP-dependent RNA helicase-like protein DB10 isoform X2 n=1 Tax=Ipomoea nil TaxID=35883 RepID=UPI0009016318|nr:PREDICTED: ATP-dependent RNA helicase-like protein DB10 isoform X2 [Ipomoea nil]
MFVAGTAVGDDSICHVVRMEEEESSCSSLQQYALAAYVYQAGFSAPTPIQAQSWPVALQGRDIVAIAKTGSGKTLGYLIPGFIHLKQRRNNSRLGPTVLVLSPTRELATQIQDEAVKFSKSYQISCTCLYGGAAKGPQLRDLDRGVDIVVATPGRLNDILEMRRVSLNQVSYLVLDEADRMLDMGFEPQIRKIVKEVPTRRQTLMYTATWPKEVRKIAADLLINPVQVNIGNVDELVANKSITQYVEVLPQTDKRRRLEQILRSQEQGSKVIIFCSTKKMCNLLSGNLTRQFGAAAIHGDKSQGERDFVLNQFRTGRSPVLVATDVAARGLDIKDIRVVINYDFPTGIEDYVHRIGRTGRAGATGLAYTFFGDQDGKHASDLIKVLEGANQRVPVELRDIALRSGGMGRARRAWGSGPAGRDGGRGRYDSGNGVRDGARGSWGMSSSSDRGGGRGYDRDSRDRHGQGSRDADSFGSYHSRNFNDSVVHASDKHGRSQSRSPVRASGWSGDNRSRGRSRSRSVERFNRSNPSREGPTGRSFQEAVIPRAGTSSVALKQRSPPYDSENLRRSYANGQKDCERSPPLKGQSNREYANGSHQTCREEEEEGIIRPEEDGTYQAA